VERVRAAAVAGAFYPADPRTLSGLVGSLLAEARRQRPAKPPKALIVPHAGYVYSGPIAASAFACWAEEPDIRRIVLLGPAHHVPVRGLALPRASAHQTPLGTVRHDEAACEALTALPQVERSDAAHAREHSLEVQLPFLQSILSDFTLVPLAVGGASPEEVAEVLEALWGDGETRVVISSDLSHYLPYAEARAFDAESAFHIESLERVDPEGACGSHGVNGLLLAARRRGLRATRLDLRNSGDTAGDQSAVVGYGAWAFA
jgi:AmmeMemoRadiSam system protein B